MTITTTYEYERAIVNGVCGWIATRRIDGVFSGRQFGKTKAAARAAFE